MNDKTQDTSVIPEQNVDKLGSSPDRARFTEKILKFNALASNKFNREGFDIEKAANESRSSLAALGVAGGLQEMLAAQMLAIHELQQTSMCIANAAEQHTSRQYFTNTAIKLANTFVQQATLLAKLQGYGGQKIIVEHVDVHNGGQAVVGIVNTGTPTQEKKK